MNVFNQAISYRKDALKILERQFLLFPVCVVMLTAMTFLMGGHCSAWQWRLSLIAIVGLPFFRRGQRRSSVFAAGLFVAWLGVTYIWVLSSIDLMSTDIGGYHLPSMYMMIDGWNPVACATPEAIKGALNLEPWDMRCLHVLFVQKAVWIFNAVAFLGFYGDPLCVTLPILFFIFPGVVLSVVHRFYGQWQMLSCLVFAGLLFEYSFSAWSTVDSTIGLCGIGLLAVMANGFQQGRIISLPSLVFSFWMMNTKMSGLTSCFVFWTVFSVTMLIRYRREWVRVVRQLAIHGALLIVALAIVSASPFYSAWRDYGHPLYPFMTADAEKHPVQDITGDFKVLNEDAKQMDFIGYALNAYVSPDLARAYGNLRFGRNDFNPVSYIWKNIGPDGRSPTNLSQRIFIWTTLALLFLVPGTRLAGVQLLISMLAIPPTVYGYLRYLPFLDGLWILPVCGLLALCCHKFQTHRLLRFVNGLLWLISVAVVLLCLLKLPLQLATRIDTKQALCRFSPSKIYTNKYVVQPNVPPPAHSEEYYYNHAADPAREFINFLKLRNRRLNCLSTCEIVPLECGRVSDYKPTPLSFYVDPLQLHPMTDSEELSSLRGQSLLRYYGHYLGRIYGNRIVELWKYLHRQPCI